jgi:hypothetical protein
MDFVVLAGGECPHELKEATGCEFRADLPVGDRRMVEVVVDVLDELCEPGDRVIVVGAHVDGRESLPAGSTFLESLKSGLQCADSDVVLVATADIPYVTTESLRFFISSADQSAMMNWPIVPVSVCKQRFPNMKRTSIKVREGRFTGGNVALIHKERFKRVYPVLDRAYANRKKPLVLAGQIGVTTLLSVAIGQLVPSLLRLPALEEKVGKFLGDRVKAVVCPYAELGADVDTLEQYKAFLADFS